MGLSSNTLWQQTTKDGLKGILKLRSFLYSYCKEAVFNDLSKKEYAIPMVSFCDIPLSEQSGYLGKYGNYAIGIKRSWALKNKLNPVSYFYRDSAIFHYISGMMKKSIQDGNEEMFTFCIQMLFYAKFVEGSLPKRHIKSYRFYDERELRLCPLPSDLKDRKKKLVLIGDDYTDYKKANGSSRLDFGVDFCWDDIEYIIVKKNSEIKEFKDYIYIKLGCPEDINIVFFSEEQIKIDIIGEDHTIKEGAEAREIIGDLVWEALKEKGLDLEVKKDE